MDTVFHKPPRLTARKPMAPVRHSGIAPQGVLTILAVPQTGGFAKEAGQGMFNRKDWRV